MTSTYRVDAHLGGSKIARNAFIQGDLPARKGHNGPAHEQIEAAASLAHTKWESRYSVLEFAGSRRNIYASEIPILPLTTAVETWKSSNGET